MRLRAALCAVAIAASSSLDAGARAWAGAIVVSKESSLSPLSADLASRIFTGQLRKMDGHSVTVIFQSSGATREDFDNKVLGKSTADVNAYMAAMIFTGRAAPPTEVSGDSEVKRALAERPSAVGYISDAAVDDSVKVLLRY